MARIAGVDLSEKWKLDFALTRIKGIGWTSSDKILEALKIDKKIRVSEVSAEDVAKLAAEVEKYLIEGDLIRNVRGNVQRLKTISSFKGVRHTRGLPARGQRTRRNARTKRGKRKTVGAFKKEILAKQTQAANQK